MRVLLLVCFSFIGLSQAQQERCCLPEEQFTLLKGITTASTPTTFWGRLGGQLQISEFQSVAYDFTNNRFAARISRSFFNKPFPPQNLRIVEDANERTSYIIDLDKQTCTQENPADFPFHLERCISDYFVDIGPIKFGDSEFQITNYLINWQDEAGAAQYTISVSPKCIPVGETIVGTLKSWKVKHEAGAAKYTISVSPKCIPVGETIVGTLTSWKVKQQLTANGGFFNYTVGIEDPDSYFSLPDYCKQEKEEESGYLSWLW